MQNNIFIITVFIALLSSCSFNRSTIVHKNMSCHFYEDNTGFVDEIPVDCTNALQKRYESKNGEYFNIFYNIHIIEPTKCPSFFDLNANGSIQSSSKRKEHWKENYIAEYHYELMCLR